jgi:hypothetical protein
MFISFKAEENRCWICTSHEPVKTVKYQGYYCKVHGKATRLHRHMYRMVYGTIPKGAVVFHTCGNSLCINPGHMALGTHADNVKARDSRGTTAKGEHHGKAKLTEQDVRVIRADTQTGQKALAQRFGVDPKIIYNIKHGLSWKHVK